MGSSEDDPVNDPVNPQPQGDNSTEDAMKDPANDPVNPQPQGNRSGNDAINDPANDPVNPQPQGNDSKNDTVSDAINDPGNDPVNPQPQGRRSGGDAASDPANDPVNSQPQGNSSNSFRDQELNYAHNQPNQSKVASERLSQLSSHLSSIRPEPSISAKPAPSTPPKKRTVRGKRDARKNSQASKDDLPADYSDILSQVQKMHSLASTPDPSNRGYTRQKTSGKLWARERIAQLLDPESWREIGSVTGSTVWTRSPTNPQQESVSSFTPTNNPQGFGRITCPVTGQKRQIYLTADDFSIRSGHADGSNGLKTLHGEKLALKLKVPVVKLVDGSSGGGSVTTIKTQGYSYIPHIHILSTVVQQLNAGIPNLGAVVGPAIGLGAARVVSTHFSVMAGDIGSLFNAGPKVVQGATFEEDLSFQDLGGPDIHCRNGTIDNLAANEAEAFDQIKTVLGYLPNCGDFQPPPTLPADWSHDDPNREDLLLRTIIPRRKTRSYNPRTIITTIVDHSSFFEIGSLWGTTAIVGLARLAGRPVGILSNNCEVNSGALDAPGSQKLTRMLKFCDTFNLPILQLVDVPGYAIGTKAERDATMKWGVELAKAYYSTTTPIFSVMVRRCYGVAGGVMLDSREPVMRVAWPSAEWGSLPLEGGIEVGHRHELTQIGKKSVEEGGGMDGVKKRYKELEDEYRRLMNPVRSANAFNVEEIVDPKDTRRICCRWAREMYGVVMEERLTARKNGKIRPVFT